MKNIYCIKQNVFHKGVLWTPPSAVKQVMKNSDQIYKQPTNYTVFTKYYSYFYHF